MPGKLIRILFFFVLLGIISCDDKPVCTEMATSYLQAGFYKAVAGEEQDSVLNNVSVTGLGASEELMKNENNVKLLRLPLNFDSHESAFVITNDSVTDTLYLSYDTTLSFVSYECGFAPNYDIREVGFTTHGFDSIIIVKSFVEPVDEENLKIYL
ncbi:MAG: DUF6452 family protein [Bacteroidota bacterium]|nr:DUF6452 family protein [Bacteroidota bacterium]